MNKSMKLSEHFTLGELCKTKYVTEDGNIPSRVHIENLKRICENWLEDLRYSYNMLYVHSGVRPQSKVVAGVRPQSKVAGDCTLAVLWRQTRGLRQNWGLHQSWGCASFEEGGADCY